MLTQLDHLIHSKRSHLFVVLFVVRMLDYTQTAVGIRLGLEEVNPMVKSFGITGLVMQDGVISLLIVIIGVAWNKLAPKIKGKHEEALLPLCRILAYLPILVYLGWSIYTVAWNNPSVMLTKVSE